jgi:hypothetical protein
MFFEIESPEAEIEFYANYKDLELEFFVVEDNIPDEP